MAYHLPTKNWKYLMQEQVKRLLYLTQSDKANWIRQSVRKENQRRFDALMLTD